MQSFLEERRRRFGAVGGAVPEEVPRKKPKHQQLDHSEVGEAGGRMVKEKVQQKGGSEETANTRR